MIVFQYNELNWKFFEFVNYQIIIYTKMVLNHNQSIDL